MNNDSTPWELKALFAGRSTPAPWFLELNVVEAYFVATMAA
jgi:hypothetical protein